MNKKGFTIVELIATIMIIGIVAVIAATSVNSISSAVKDYQYKNLVNTIKVAASSYKEDTGIEKVYVDTLIKEGYLTSDDAKGNIYNPKDSNEKFNCYVVNPAEENTSDAFVSGDCTESIKNASIKICVYNKDNNCDGNLDRWLGINYIQNNKTIKLGYIVTQNDIEPENVNESFSWSTLLAPDNVYHGETHELMIEENGVIDKQYMLQIKDEVEVNEGGTILKDYRYYEAAGYLKVDAAKPNVYVTPIGNTNADWVSEATMNFIFEDKGSGLDKYCLYKKKSDGSFERIGNCVTLSGNKTEITRVFTENNTYKLIAYDKVGNTSDEKEFIITNIDDRKPACYYGTNRAAVWTNQPPVHIEYGCTDEESGCSNNTSLSFTESTKTYRVNSFTAKDNANNEVTCAGKIYNIYLDVDKPTITDMTITSSNSDFNTPLVSVKVSAKDQSGLSGLSKVCLTTTNSRESCEGKWQTMTSSPYTVSYTFDGTMGSGLSYNLYAYVKDAAGNVSEAFMKTYQIYRVCDQTIKGHTSSINYCTGDNATYNKYDSYKLNNQEVYICDSGSEYIYPDHYTCCSLTNDYPYAYCSNSCGYGYWIVVNHSISAYDSSYSCGGYLDEQRWNTCYDTSYCQPTPVYPPYQPEPDPEPELSCDYVCSEIPGFASTFNCYCEGGSVTTPTPSPVVPDTPVTNPSDDCSLSTSWYTDYNQMGFRSKRYYNNDSCVISSVDFYVSGNYNRKCGMCSIVSDPTKANKNMRVSCSQVLANEICTIEAYFLNGDRSTNKIKYEGNVGYYKGATDTSWIIADHGAEW